jgi:hypothetical protein
MADIKVVEEKNTVKVNPRDTNVIAVQEVRNYVEVSASGPQGIQGPAGAAGAAGEQGEPGRFTVSETAPASPTAGDAWFRSSTAQLYLYYDGYWVETSTSYAGPTGETGEAGAQGAQGQGFDFRGPYTPGAIYNEYFVVTYNGSTYVCRENGVVNVVPGSSPTWDLFAEKGATGATGATGPQGPQGEQGEPGTFTYPADTTFTVEGGSLGTSPTFNGAPLFTGSYIKMGKFVHFRIDVDFDNITSFGTGQYYLNLPFAPKYNYQFKNGCLHDISSGRQYAIGGHVYANNAQMLLSFTNSNGQDDEFDHNSPITLNVADNFHIAGDYITESA